MKKLFIVESPNKAKTIQKYLGNDYVVMASSGHVRDLNPKALSVEIENNFKPIYEVNADKKEIIKKLKAAVRQYPEVYLATDPDREGEAISWHLQKVLELPEGQKNRITYNEITKKAILDAIEHPREIDMKLVDAQQARRVLDRLVGFKISPILSNKIKTGSSAQKAQSAGRVQSVALEMIVTREREIRDFKPEEYWTVSAMMLKNGLPNLKKNVVKTTFNDVDGKKVKLQNKEQTDKIVAQIASAKRFWVDSAVKSEAKGRPQPPFTTSTLQQDASQKLNMQATVTMRLAQQLYEGVDIGGDTVALVTYIRTDSVRINPEMQFATLKFIRENYGEAYAPKRPNVYKTKADAQDAHEAIRPIHLDRTPESLSGKIDKNLLRLYKLIYDRYLASQMSDAVYDTLKVHINGDGADGREYGFKLTGRTVKFDGFTVLYNQTSSDDEEDDTAKTLPKIEEGDELTVKEVLPEQKFTKPPSRYNDATIIKAMEENGIGRPSTYAQIVSKLEKQAYIKRESKALVPTELGEVICDYLVLHFPQIMDLKFTAKMEGALDRVAEDGVEWQRVIASFYPKFHQQLMAAGRNGNKVHMEEKQSGVKCEKCGATMVIKEGKYGKFLACPNYPKCKNIKSLSEVVGKCPKCGKDVLKRTSHSGKTFYGCSGYPQCDFVSWEIPAPYFCPKCGGVMKVTELKNGVKYTCVNRNCAHSETIVKKEEQN